MLEVINKNVQNLTEKEKPLNLSEPWISQSNVKNRHVLKRREIMDAVEVDT